MTTTDRSLTEPVTELDQRYSSPESASLTWEVAREHWAKAELYWLSTVRPDGRPHVTPLISLWWHGAAYVCTGPDERKAKNLAHNRHVVLTTGCNGLNDGVDLVIEGVAEPVTDGAELAEVAAGYEEKYGSGWHFDVRDGAFFGDGGR